MSPSHIFVRSKGANMIAIALIGGAVAACLGVRLHQLAATVPRCNDDMIFV